MANLITQNDFNCIGQVAKHCDLTKLCIAIEESQNFDLMPLICPDFYNDLVTNIANPFYNNLWNGGQYIGCNGKTEIHFGLKKVLVYYSYSRYILINAYNDTANGLVQKQNEYSIPTPLKELQAFSDKYRNMGKDAFELTLKYLCKNKDIFTKFESTKCGCECDCNDCKGGETKKQFGIRTYIIEK
jgi:hypothetical protein